jgi:hypothetical protein
MHFAKRTSCRRCRALIHGEDKYTLMCALGYKINFYCIPSELCPKPMTWHDASIAKQTMRKII